MEPSINIGQKGEMNLKGLVITLYQLLVTENKQFDLIIAPGTTGAFVCKLTEMIYQKLDKPFPSKVILPIVRYVGPETSENLFDNGIFYDDLKDQIERQNVGIIKEILFVDDEIFAGNALRECLKLILQYKAEKEIGGETICIVVAEDQEMAEGYMIPNVQIRFEFFGKVVNHFHNSITYYLPASFEDKVIEVLGDKIGTHAVVNILFDLPIKPRENGQVLPKFTDEFNKIAREKISNFDQLQKQAIDYTNKLIDNYLSEIKNKSLT